MSLTYTYDDAYLCSLVTPAREAQAAADVALLGELPPDWVDKLTVLRAYIITCLQCQKAPDDTFAAKLTAYRREYADAMAQARAAQAAIAASQGTASGGSFFSIELVRA